MSWDALEKAGSDLLRGLGPSAACDRLISALAGRFEDDVTVVLVRMPTTGTGPPDLNVSVY
jgi:hypothetical protein